MDLFKRLPADVFHKILFLLTTTASEEEQPTIHSVSLPRRRFPDTKEALKTCIVSKTFLQACSTLPVLSFSNDAVFKYNRGKKNSKTRANRFAKYLNHTLSRYQQNNIPIQTLCLDVCVKNVRFANFLDQYIRKAHESGVVKEIHLNLSNLCNLPLSNLLQSLFSYKKLVSLSLSRFDILTSNFEFLINPLSLRTLHLDGVCIEQCALEKLFYFCPLIEELQFLCFKTAAIKVANLPNLKWLEVSAISNQSVDVNAPSLELFKYEGSRLTSSNMPSIQSTQNLKALNLQKSTLTDGQFHNLIATCPVLEQLILEDCLELENIKVSSHSLTFLRLKYCIQLTKLKIDAPLLNEFEFVDNYKGSHLSFESTQNLKTLSLRNSTLTDGQFHNLIATCPVLEQLILEDCLELENIKVSSHSLTCLRLKSGIPFQLTELKIDAPLLTEFEFDGYKSPSSFAFTSGDSRATKSSVILTYSLIQEQEFLKLSEFLKAFKSSDNISLIIYSDKISFDRDTFNVLKDDTSIIPEFEQVYILVLPPLSSVYSSLMEGLLASFSPKILVLGFIDEDSVKYLCKELLLVEGDNSNITTRPSQNWRNYFKQVMLKGIDEKWRPLHSWESMEEILKYLGDREYFVKLSPMPNRPGLVRLKWLDSLLQLFALLGRLLKTIFGAS